jgi:glucosamine-6-phosphate deaminase
MIIKTFSDSRMLGQKAALQASVTLKQAAARSGVARVIAATGASQFLFLEALTVDTSVPWKQVELFHLDEYIGLSISHPASFRKYLKERLVDKTGIPIFHGLDGEKDPAATCLRVGRELSASPIDVAFIGIGENGHIAFNDPPADFTTRAPYIVVDLDEPCRRQQVGEGWYPTLTDVPKQAITMSVRQILQAREILCIVPDERKALAVKQALECPISPLVPASILRTHPSLTLYLDTDSASLLSPHVRAASSLPVESA